MEKLSLALIRTFFITMILCVVSTFISSKDLLIYAVVCGSVYALACFTATLKIGIFEKAKSTDKKRACYIIVYAISDYAVGILSFIFVGPMYSYVLATAITAIWFLRKLTFFIAINET